jgi:hypothetical protein
MSSVDGDIADCGLRIADIAAINPQSAFRNPQLIRNPQSAIRIDNRHRPDSV